MGLTLQQVQAQGGSALPNGSSAGSLYQNFVKNNVAGAYTPIQPQQPNIAEKAISGVENFGENVAGDVKSGFQQAGQDLTQTEGGTSGQQVQGGFQAAGDVAGAALSPLTEGIKGIANALAGNKGVQDVANSGAGNAVAGAESATSKATSPITDKLNAWATQHPEAAKDLGALGNIASLATVIPGGEAAADVAPDLASKAKFVAEDAITPKGDSGLHIEGENGSNLYAKITPEQQAFLKDEINKIPFNSTDKPHLTPLNTLENDLKGEAANAAKPGSAPQRVSLDEIKAQSPNAKEALDNFDKQNGSPKTSKVDPADVLKSPTSQDELAKAADEGRVKMANGKSTVLPSKSDLAMQKALQPLIDEGKINSDKELGTGLIKGDTQLKNIANTNDEITSKGTELRQGLKDSKAIWNSNELKGRLNSVDVPDPVKNESTLNKNATSLRNATVKMAEDAQKDPSGILDLRQKFDDYVQKNYGKSFFDKGRNYSPQSSYIYSLRDELNNFAADKLPEGKLPNGTDYKDALMNQHQLINAKDEMTAKFAREYPEGMSKLSRVMKAHPALRMGTRIIGRQILRIPITLGEGELGVTALERAATKSVK